MKVPKIVKSIVRAITLIASGVMDLLMLYAPQHRRMTKFAFLVHPRDLSDVYRKYPFLYSLGDEWTKKFITLLWPVTVSRITGAKDDTGKLVDGYMISIPMTSDQMMNDRGRAKKEIVRGVRLAQKKGARMVGLGALTASLTNGGLDIVNQTEAKINTGRIFTSFIVTNTVKAVTEKLSLDRKEVMVAILGAAGSIGTASAQILARNGFKNFILVDLSSKTDRVNNLVNKIVNESDDIRVQVSDSLDAIKTADIIIAVTNRPDALIRSEHLKSGAVVVDDAQPSDVDPDIVKDRKDVLVLEGGVVHSEEIDPHFNFGLKHKKDIFSCLAETILLTNIGYKDNFQVGEIFDIDWDALEKLKDHAEHLGFRLGSFQNFLKVYSDEEIAFVRSIKNRKGS